MGKVLHQYFLDGTGAAYQERMGSLSSKIAESWPKPKFEDLNDVALLQRMVAKSVFFIMFGVWLSDEEATTLTGWRTNAGLFILPRFVQRVLFNFGINKVKALRVDTVRIIEAHNLEPVFKK